MADGAARRSAGEPVIEAAGLSFTYPGAPHRALEGVDLTVRPGEIIALLGPSGAGKSTTQHILTGRLRGYEGTARLLGQHLANWRQSLYAKVGVSFEEPACYAKLTAREQLAYFASLIGRPTRSPEELLVALGLGEAIDVRTGEFSKGMRVRLDLARALQHRPDVLFLDEPTSGLDPVSSSQVRALISAEAERGAAILLTTHDMVTADLLADRVALIMAGRVAATGSPRELKLRSGKPQVQVEYRTDHGMERQTFELSKPQAELHRLLRSGQVETLHTTEPTLAEVFVALTGRQLT